MSYFESCEPAQRLVAIDLRMIDYHGIRFRWLVCLRNLMVPRQGDTARVVVCPAVRLPIDAKENGIGPRHAV